MRLRNAQRGVSSWQDGYDIAWCEALEKVRSTFNLFSTAEEVKDMNIWKILNDLWSDASDFKAAAADAPAIIAELKAGQMPTAAQIAVLEKLVKDVVQIADAL